MDHLSQESDFLTNSDMEVVLKELDNEEDGQFKYSNGLHEQSILLQLQNGQLPLQGDLALHDSLVALEQDLSVPPPSPTDTIPSREYWKGPFNFEIFLDSSTSGKRSWVYSTVLNKVFLDMSKSLLVGFKVSPYLPNMRIRALPVYSLADYIKEPVERCQLHYLYDDPYQLAHSQEEPRVCQCENYNFARHLVMSSHSQALYNYDGISNRHSVMVPLDAPPAGIDVTTVEYRFTCKTSCPRGMNRRPIQVVFTLETTDCRVMGRQAIGVKICSCPRRDKDKEEGDAKANGGQQYPGSSKRKISKNDLGQTKKIKSENPATPQEENNGAGEPNEMELSAQISSLNCQVKRLEAMVAEQKEQLKHYQTSTLEQLMQLEARVEQTAAEQSARMEQTAAEQSEHLRRLETKLDALLNIQWKA